ncbi:MAG: homocysteine S-methyltransferase family protein [Anaerolineales bacterium]|nr:homocysteine S-methyltransferase family protein [Anaerolineales bacterium]
MDLLRFVSKNRGKVLLDGGMGTQLGERGAPMGGIACLTHPDDVLAVHRSYVQAGADILITNTLTMNRVNIDTHDLGIDVREVNIKGAELARQGIGKEGFVLGDISTTGKMMAPIGDLTEARAFEAFQEQAGYLAEGGVDGFIIETMFDLNEAVVAVKACKTAAPGLPVLASMTFETLNRGGRTMMGNSAADCARSLDQAGADMIGTNCGSLNPVEMAEIVKILVEAADKPVVVQPNAGKPRFDRGKTLFDMTPDQFVEGISICLDNGASLIGGCCGTTPAHIARMRELVPRD